MYIEAYLHERKGSSQLEKRKVAYVCRSSDINITPLTPPLLHHLLAYYTLGGEDALKGFV